MSVITNALNEAEKPIVIALIVLVVSALIIVGPLATITALNFLFLTEIPYTFWSWLSMLWLIWILKGHTG